MTRRRRLRRPPRRRNRAVQIFQISDALWNKIEPLIPVEEPSSKGGRRPISSRIILNAIFYVLRTGGQWKSLDHVEMGCSGSAAHARFQKWVQQGVFERLWKEGLSQYDELKGIDWSFTSVDGAMSKAPLGGGATGPNPTDRAKSGTKRSLQTDARGIPIGLAVAGANRHDMKLLVPTLDSVAIERPSVDVTGEQGLCLDKGYDYPECRDQAEERDYVPHIRSRGEEIFAKESQPRFRARRWVVERTHSWMNRFRRVLTRWEKKVENYVGMLHLACAIITFRGANVF